MGRDHHTGLIIGYRPLFSDRKPGTAAHDQAEA